MPDTKTLGVLLIEGFADWEYPLLTASAREWFGIDVGFLTPGAAPVTSIAGLRFADGDAFEKATAGTFDALAVIGSDNWTGNDAPDIADALPRPPRSRHGHRRNLRGHRPPCPRRLVCRPRAYQQWPRLAPRGDRRLRGIGRLSRCPACRCRRVSSPRRAPFPAHSPAPLSGPYCPKPVNRSPGCAPCSRVSTIRKRSDATRRPPVPDRSAPARRPARHGKEARRKARSLRAHNLS